MTDLAVQKSLLAVTKLKTRNGETAEEFTRRVWQKCQALEDEAWQSLGEPAQAWVNDYTVKNENKAPLPVLALPEIEAQAAKEQAQVVEQQEKVPMAKKAKSKAPEAIKKATEDLAAKNAEKEATKAAKKAEKEAAKAAKAENGGRRGRKPVGLPDESAKIVIIQPKPPGRDGTRRQKVFSCYKTGMTVREARDAGVPYNFMRWHVEQGWIELRTE